MYSWLTDNEGTEGLQKLRSKIIEKMVLLDPSTDEYARMMRHVEDIDKMLLDRTKLANEIVEQENAERERHRFHISGDTIVNAVASIGGILLIINKEQVVPVVSKAFNFIVKGRG